MRTLQNSGKLYMIAAVVILLAMGWAIDSNAYESKSDRRARVSVDIKPLQLRAGQPARFEVRMNTHSVDLSQDMVSVSLLKDDQGREYQPVEWRGSKPGGHHRNGILIFPDLIGTPKSVTLIIRDIAAIPQRVYEWEME